MNSKKNEYLYVIGYRMYFLDHTEDVFKLESLNNNNVCEVQT